MKGNNEVQILGLPGSRAGALLCVTWCASFPALSVGATDVKLSRKTESYCRARFQFCPMITAMPLVPNRLHGSVKLRGGVSTYRGCLALISQGKVVSAVQCRAEGLLECRQRLLLSRGAPQPKLTAAHVSSSLTTTHKESCVFGR